MKKLIEDRCLLDSLTLDIIGDKVRFSSRTSFQVPLKKKLVVHLESI